MDISTNLHLLETENLGKERSSPPFKKILQHSSESLMLGIVNYDRPYIGRVKYIKEIMMEKKQVAMPESHVRLHNTDLYTKQNRNDGNGTPIAQ